MIGIQVGPGVAEPELKKVIAGKLGAIVLKQSKMPKALSQNQVKTIWCCGRPKLSNCHFFGTLGASGVEKVGPRKKIVNQKLLDG